MEKKVIDNKLEQLGIYELRSLARSVGVKSPTTKKREELINLIQDIRAGKTAPVLNNHFGRPCKNLSNEKELSDIIMNRDTELMQKINVSNCNILCFNQELESGEYPLSHNQIIVCGILRQTSNGTYYMLNNLKLSEKVYVILTKEMVDKFELIPGDIVSGTAFKDETKNYAYINEITKINGKLTDEKLKFDAEQELIISNNIIFDNAYEGSFFLEQKTSMNDAINFISSQADILNTKGYKCVVVGLDISVQTKLKLNNINNTTQIVTLVENSAAISKDTLFDAINHINALQQREEKVMVFILDILGIYHILDVVFQSEVNIHNEDVENTIKKLVSLCKATRKSSVSICGITFDYQQNDYVNEIRTLNRLSFN